MAREQQKGLAQRFINAQSKGDVDTLRSVLAPDAKHDLLPASLGILQTIKDVEQRKTALFIEKQYEFGPVQSFYVLNFDADNSKITHTIEFANGEAWKKLSARVQQSLEN
ncbi:hypothetical protein EJ03DRAFT_350191 [Teratosphaeria nubilosa]|uniref:Uncharacterized protein n=1 Tax=Teratosphaeria nubilosa TaxID=161662 RepID=A0A6G1LCC8_9PEZI|nr:hypothetical protein EJ03DRAFT_350191 [Teratosphaeria nubilosa]